jgi:hypothetical protein
MATDKHAAWGRATFRHWYVGHFHSQRVHEFQGCSVEYVRTLAAKDAWHTAHGYRALRDMRCVVYHRQFGEVESHRVGIEAVMAAEQEEAA